MTPDSAKEIVEWSANRPAWQRDALRRLFTTGLLSAQDLSELVLLCKASRGLADPVSPSPLLLAHLPAAAASGASISLAKVLHHQGVNALAPNQELSFDVGLNVVYGANAAGKSGYARILKGACRARAREQILGNVLGDTAPIKADVTVDYRVGNKAESARFTLDSEGPGALGAVSVFDAQCAPVYLRDRTDVAFRPAGTDVFDKLAVACADIRKVLEKEESSLRKEAIPLPNLPEGTKARALLDNLTALTSLDDVRGLAGLSSKEKSRLASLRQSLRDLQATDPAKRAVELAAKEKRLGSLSKHLEDLELRLGHISRRNLSRAVESLGGAKSALDALRQRAFPADVLPETGGTTWREMMDAVAAFTVLSLPDVQFPRLEEGVRCPFCQQPISADSAERLSHFAEFLESESQDLVRSGEANVAELRDAILGLPVSREDVDMAIGELGEENPPLAERTRAAISTALALQAAVRTCFESSGTIPETEFSCTDVLAELAAARKDLLTRVAALKAQKRSLSDQDTHDLRELEARTAVREHIKNIEAEIERQKKLAAFRQCFDDTNTQPITVKGSDLTKRLVTSQLKGAFKQELELLGFKHLNVELREAGGSKGALFHRLVFANAPGVTIVDVLSEGESRALSLAAFLAELSTADARSAIIFDDPVSSLDHVWRERIANRLVTESKTRQVIGLYA